MTDLMRWVSGQGPIFNYRHFKALLMASVGIIDHTSVCVCFLCSDSTEEHEKSIFRWCSEHGYRLKNDIQFHLYISTSPCGDARIFSPHEAAAEGVEFFMTDGWIRTFCCCIKIRTGI